jgi:hypothetical protein
MGLADMSWNIADGHSYVLNSTMDRLNASWEKEKWRITLGRQRINWSQTWVWNPNDIFNTYSFFDFDYAERPGSDAARIQYYNSEVSVTEVAAKLNKDKKLTAAAYYKFNKWETDFQLIGGLLNEQDYVAGAGFSGAIKSVAIRSEFSYFQPVKHFADTSGLFLGSFAIDYSFSNSIGIMAEFLYNSKPVKNISSLMSYYSAPLTVKNLSFAEYNLFFQASYPVSPLISTSIGGMYFPKIKGYYLGPSLSYSASDNIEISFYLQSFGADLTDATGNKTKMQVNMAFLRGKFSF